MSKNRAEIAGNQVQGAQKCKHFLGEDPFLFSLDSLFVVGPSTEKSLIAFVVGPAHRLLGPTVSQNTVSQKHK